jgi:hypothetical protein
MKKEYEKGFIGGLLFAGLAILVCKNQAIAKSVLRVILDTQKEKEEKEYVYVKEPEWVYVKE